MGRSRSRSPARKEKRRSRSKERDRDRQKRRHKSRSRSPRPPNRRSRSRSPHRPASPAHRSRSPDNDDVVFLGTTRGPVATKRTSGGKRSKNQLNEPVIVDATGDDDVELIPDEDDMMKLMGFAGFDTTKGKHVAGNDVYVANIVQKRKYRQYMNRRGGFNRPLDYVA